MTAPTTDDATDGATDGAMDGAMDGATDGTCASLRSLRSQKFALAFAVVAPW
jgi:hypothetical protein